jgi:protoporphyrinogen oxidase
MSFDPFRNAARWPIEQYDHVILGAGISGLTAADVLATADQGSRILVIEEYPHVGGNHKSVEVNGYTFDVGSFIFRSDAAHLTTFPVLRRVLQPAAASFQRVNPAGKLTKYPFSVVDDIVAAGPLAALGYVGSLLWARVLRQPMHNAADFCSFWIGSRFFRASGLEHYIKRFFGLDAEQIDLDFAKRRMTWISDAANLSNRVRHLLRKGTKKTIVQTLVRPATGFAPMYDQVREEIEKRGVKFIVGTEILSLTRKDGKVTVSTLAGTFAAERVHSTIPLARAAELAGLGKEVDFESVELVSLFFSHEGARGFNSAILYNFTSGGIWKRLTVYSDFYGKVKGRDYFTVEVNRPADGADIAHLEADFRASCAELGLFRGDLRLEGTHELTSAYPALRIGAPARARRLVDMLHDLGIESFGRQGEFDYLPTADKATNAVRGRDWSTVRSAATADAERTNG